MSRIFWLLFAAIIGAVALALFLSEELPGGVIYVAAGLLAVIAVTDQKMRQR